MNAIVEKSRRQANHFLGIVFLHTTRSLDWRLKDVEPSFQESRALLHYKIADEILQKYYIWRRSSLMLASLFVLLDSIIVFVGIIGYIENARYFNSFGKCCFAMEYLAQLVLTSSVGVALYFVLKKPNTSVLVLGYGWLASTIIPVWPFVIPLQYLMAEEVRGPYLNTVEGFIFRSSIGLIYATFVLPIIATIPSGLIRGALRVRGLLPERGLAGWVIVAAAPTYPLVALGVVAILSQSSGDFILMTGGTLFLVAPTGYSLRRRVFTKPNLTDRDMLSLTRTIKIISVVQTVGVCMIMAWVLIHTAVELRAVEMLQFAVSFVGRLLVATLVFTSVVLEVTASNAQEMLCAPQMDAQDRMSLFQRAYFGSTGSASESKTSRKLRVNDTPDIEQVAVVKEVVSDDFSKKETPVEQKSRNSRQKQTPYATTWKETESVVAQNKPVKDRSVKSVSRPTKTEQKETMSNDTEHSSPSMKPSSCKTSNDALFPADALVESDLANQQTLPHSSGFITNQQKDRLTNGFATQESKSFTETTTLSDEADFDFKSVPVFDAPGFVAFGRKGAREDEKEGRGIDP